MKKISFFLLFYFFVLSLSHSQYLYIDTAMTTDVGYNGAPMSFIFSGGNLIGATASISGGYSVADDFTVPPGQVWTIDSVKVNAYQSNSGLTSTINDARIRIWNGDPMVSGSTIVYSNLTSAAYIYSSWSGIYRYTGNSRPIMWVTLNGGSTVLNPGNYYVEYWLGGTINSGPYTTPKVLPGRINPPNQNARYRNITTNIWNVSYDNSNPIGFNLIVIGSKQITSCPNVTGLNARNITSTTATLGWLSFAPLYNVKYNIGSNFDPNTGGIQVNPNPTDTTCSLSGLTPNTGVYWYVKAICSQTYQSSWAGPHFFTTTVPCPEPTNLSARSIIDSSAELNWISSASVFDIELREVGNPPTGNPTVTGVGRPYKYTGLLASKNYYYYVRANCGGLLSSWAGPYDFTTLPYNPFLVLDTAMVTDPGWNGRKASCVFTGGNIEGLSCGITSNFWAFDDFNVPAGQTWRIDSVRLFGYKSVSLDTNANFTIAKINIWKGRPDSLGSIVYSDTSGSNVLSSVWTGIYRVSSDNLLNTYMPINYATLNAGGITLDEGNYWIQYKLGSSSGSPVTPIKVLPGRINPPNQNAMLRHINGNYIYSTDGGQRIGFNIIVMGRNMTGVPVHSNGTDVPSEYKLSQNYPNPFNPVTNITYSIPHNAFVTLIVYDLLGREVAKLVNEKQNAGVYEISFDATNYTSGVYFYRISANSFSETKKMVIIK